MVGQDAALQLLRCCTIGRSGLGLLGINWLGAFIGGAILGVVLSDRVRNFRRSE